VKVHQLLAALSYGDAIGNEALAIQRQLRAAGHESDIFAELVHPRVAHLARPLWEYGEVSSPETVCIYHFSIGSAAGRLVHGAPDRLVIVYHNITPARFFLGFHSHLAGLCHHGRRELEAFASRTELGLGDSEFNRVELEASGFSRTAVLPIVLDLSLYDRPLSPVVRRRYDDGRVNVLFVGRVIPNKRFEDLIRSFAVFQRWLKPRSRLLLEVATCWDAPPVPSFPGSRLAWSRSRWISRAGCRALPPWGCRTPRSGKGSSGSVPRSRTPASGFPTGG